jgi:hypothetical protein
MRQKTRVLTLIDILTSSAERQRPSKSTMMDVGKGDPFRLTWQEPLSFERLAIPAAGKQHVVVWAGRGSAPTF